MTFTEFMLRIKKLNERQNHYIFLNHEWLSQNFIVEINVNTKKL